MALGKHFLIYWLIKYDDIHFLNRNNEMIGWLCLTSHRQRGHLETAPPFTVPYEGREAR